MKQNGTQISKMEKHQDQYNPNQTKQNLGKINVKRGNRCRYKPPLSISLSLASRWWWSLSALF